MKEKELLALLEKVNKEVAEKIKDFVTNEDFKATKEDLKTIKEAVEALDLKEITEKLDKLKESGDTDKFAEKEVIEKSIEDLKGEIQEQIDAVGVELKKIGETSGNFEAKTLSMVIKEALETDAIKEYLEAGGKGNSAEVQVDIKAVVDMTGFTGDVVTPGRVGPQVSFQPPKKFDIRDAMATGTSDVDSIDHIKETGLVDASGFLAENVASAESDVNLEQVKTSSTRIATHINVSKRSLRNVAFLQSHLTNRFSELIAVQLTDSVLNGAGAGNEFNGFFNNANTFSAGSLAGKVDEANSADVIAAAIARLNEITNLEANAIFMNPLDVYLLGATKDTTGQYAESNIIVSRINGRLHINGVPVWATHHVAFDKYLVADLSATSTEFLEVEGLTMAIFDQHASNAIENQVTFVFEMEAILPIYKTFAFLKGTISTDKALLETP